MPLAFQDMLFELQRFWGQQGCAVLPGYDAEVGAGTFHPATVMQALGPRPWNAVFVQPSRRPQDGRYGENPNRVVRHHQLQVLMKPSPPNIQDLALKSFESIGLSPKEHDFRFVEDDWESPTLGAAGLGWEVWCDGMEILQFTYFQQIGGMALDPITAELTYGLERIALFLQNKENVFDLDWNGVSGDARLTYGDIYHKAEKQFSHYHFEEADVPALEQRFQFAVQECEHLLQKGLPLPAYDRCIHASHLFNMLDARGALSVSERAKYIGDVRALAMGCFKAWRAQTEGTAA